MILKRFVTIAACTSLLAVAACASPSRPEFMTVPATAGLTAAPGDVGYHSVTTINVAGGHETNPLWTAQVSDADFKAALEASLTAAGYMGSEGAPLTVTATMVDLKQPLAGFDMSVTSQVQYRVTRNGQVIFADTVSATGTATMGQAFAAVERLRLANEKSIQENIKEFLKRFRANAR
jgi:hypothetical protein